MYYSSITLVRFSIFTIGSCIVIFSRDVGGQQQLPLQVSVDRTVCNSASTDNDFVANEDRIIIKGTLDFTGKDPNDWPVYLPVENTKDNSSFLEFCTVDAVNDGCRNRGTTGCYCKSSTFNTYDIVVNQTLPLGLNGSYLRVSWTDLAVTGTEEFYTSKLNIYPPTVGTVSTDGGGKRNECRNLPNENCTLHVTEYVRYSVKFFVNGLEDPTFKIKFDEEPESSIRKDYFSIDKKFTQGNRTIQAKFSFKENSGCRRSKTFVVSFAITSLSLPSICSWIILVISLVAVVVGALISAISVGGYKHGWCSCLKHKSGGADVSEADKEMKCGPSSPLNSEEIEFGDTDVKSGTMAKPVM